MAFVYHKGYLFNKRKIILFPNKNFSRFGDAYGLYGEEVWNENSKKVFFKRTNRRIIEEIWKLTLISKSRTSQLP